MALIDREWAEVITTIESADGGMGGGSRSPSDVLEETEMYFNVKAVTGKIRGEIERYKKKKRQRGRR
jgi:hypothetical protein